MSIAPSVSDHELRLASRVLASGLHRSELSVPSIHCGACIARIERLLGALPGVEQARANLSTRRVTVDWRGEEPPGLIAVLEDAGFAAHLHDPAVVHGDGATRELVRALAVAGFAAGNIMMLSVAVWAGADPESRDIFHWLSAAIALPALAYSGRVFFRSAWQAVRHGRTNMDVPVSIGVLLAFGMSLYETIHHGPYAYFDAATSLLFVLLVGRTLDHVMRERASTAVEGLARLAARGATVRQLDGTCYLPVEDIRPGMILLLAAGDRVPVDGRVVAGRSEIDASLVSGESLPRPVTAGSLLQAGALNLAGPIEIEATATADDSFLAEMTRLMTAADPGRAGYRRLADRAARLYAPVVHLTAFATFAGWMLASGDAHLAITTAIAVLIITCPCALGLAVPMVQVVAAQRLFKQGVMIKGGGALERLAEADHVVFDKTGTLTTGRPGLVGPALDTGWLAIAAALAARSRHPYAQAIAADGRARQVPALEPTDFAEHPGAGLEGRIRGTLYRLGRPAWSLRAAEDEQSNVVLSAAGRRLCGFAFVDELRVGTQQAIDDLQARGFGVEVVSGDREESVRGLAGQLGLPFRGEVTPAAKVAHVAALAAAGRKVLMVGDGLNDAPALAAAHVSMAVASATDVGRSAADIVFLRDDLRAVPETVAVAHAAGRLVRQNLALAVAYNALAIPIAVLGLVTPLIAAVAMSVSSLAVVANALRLARRFGGTAR
jgi:Cu2+-exporting ATPase